MDLHSQAELEALALLGQCSDFLEDENLLLERMSRQIWKRVKTDAVADLMQCSQYLPMWPLDKLEGALHPGQLPHSPALPSGCIFLLPPHPSFLLFHLLDSQLYCTAAWAAWIHITAHCYYTLLNLKLRLICEAFFWIGCFILPFEQSHCLHG